MYELLIILSKYLFLFYIIYFLLQSIKIILTRQNMLKSDIKRCISKQYVILIMFHITAFSILSFNSETNSFKPETLLVYFFGMLLFIISHIVIKFTYPRSDKLIWNSIFFLCGTGLVMLQRLNPELAQKQLVWLFSGFLITFLMPFALNFIKDLSKLKYLYLGLSILMLVLTFFFGETEHGAKNWLTIKMLTFQPSEPIKLLFVLYLAAELAKPKLKLHNILISTIISGLVILFLVFQKDLGSALIFFATYMVVIYISTSSNIILFSGTLLAAIGSFIAYTLFDHIKIRVSSWLNPWADIENGGYQITQSLFAIGTYGLTGSGLNRGMPSSIPVVERDFIFSAICEEFGVLFAICIILIFLTIFYSCIKIALKSRNRYMSVLVSALTCLMCFQTFLIIGGVTKLIPMTGVTLPYISYGGTSIIICFITSGIIQWVCTLDNQLSRKTAGSARTRFFL